MMNHHDITKEFAKRGRVWLRNMLSDGDLARLDRAADDRSKPGQRLGPSDALQEVLRADSSLMQAVRLVDPAARPVRVVAFNKSEDANWGVQWHQDRIIAVAERAEVAGFGNWTRKSGLWHCEPPQSVLDAMLFTRVHLDDTDASNGAMEIAVGSHAQGKIAAPDAESAAARYPLETCDARRGDVLILRMLTLHASKPARVRSGRRVLRIDFASCDLPAPLRWAGMGADRGCAH